MTYKIGDYVRFLNEKQEGVVTRIIDHQLIGVTIDGDFEITVLAKEIVLVQSAESQLREDLEELPLANQQINSSTEQQLYLAIVNDIKISHLFHIYLVNGTSYDIALNFSIQKDQTYEGVYFDIILSRSSQRIASQTLTELDQGSSLHFQILRYKDGPYQPVQPMVLKKIIKAKQVMTQQKDIPFLTEKGFLSLLEVENNIQVDVNELQNKLLENKTSAGHEIHMPSREVDLHIEEITENFPTMKPDEMLRLQLETFRRSLEAAIAHHYANIIFIHGVGNGTLRNEIHKQLGKHPHVKTFKDARKEKFGYGATEVILK
ncbi:MAG: Smr/MutS family protein [bacterium]|jgi:hypothetical protein